MLPIVIQLFLLMFVMLASAIATFAMVLSGEKDFPVCQKPMFKNLCTHWVMATVSD